MEDKFMNKVYINPNYKSSQRSNNSTLKQHNTIYINQNFVKSSIQPVNAKIFVNPNFIKEINTIQAANKNEKVSNQFNYSRPFSTEAKNPSSYTLLPNQIPESPSTTSSSSNVTVISTHENIDNKSRYSLKRNVYPQNVQCTNLLKVDKQKENTHITKNNNLQLPILKSRYHLIRKNETKISNRQLPEKSRLKINKYKMITVTNTQKNEIYLKDKGTKCVYTSQQKARRNSLSTQAVLNRSLVKSSSSTIYSLAYTKVNQKIRKSFTKQKSDYKATIENIKGKSKLNNIPCLLFSKYGQCLRNMKGKCEYLHDKKHVKLCRNFLKGICHDEKCYLSHELSMKKMPTCYFYLKGVCFKDNCPYLHVKLSEKTKICKDFIQGYCEKGEDCSFRHVKPQKKKKTLNLKSQVLPKTVKKLLMVKKCTIDKVPINNPVNLLEKDSSENSEDINIKKTMVDSRYFKEIVNEDINNCNMIKPTRCKLGALPSFIQL